jgi:nucleoside-diphosphate-sugar epimerase
MNAYLRRRVLVVGGLGYIGRHVTERLRAAGADVTVVTRALARHRDAVAGLETAGVRLVEADLRDAPAMRAAVGRQDVVFNLAGHSGAVRSMEDPATDLDVNCRGNLVLLEALRVENPSAVLVFVSSRLAYGKGGAAPVDEARPLDPLCIHAVHKAAVEQYLRIYGRTYGLRFSIARLTNPYGPGQPSGRTAYGVVNHLIHRALEGAALPIYGDGAQRRDYIYMDDAVDALLAMGMTPAADGRTYNVGSGVGTRMIDMARAIIDIACAGSIEFTNWPPIAGQIETGDFVADTARIRSDTGWTPRVGLVEGLQRTIAFYRSGVASSK